MKLAGAGFRAGSKVKIVMETPKRVTVGSAVAQSDGTFKASVIVPRHTGPGTDRLQVVGTGLSGRPMSLAAPVVILEDEAAVATPLASPSLAEPVLLTLSIVLPMVTWLALEMFGWRNRRLDKRVARH